MELNAIKLSGARVLCGRWLQRWVGRHCGLSLWPGHQPQLHHEPGDIRVGTELNPFATADAPKVRAFGGIDLLALEQAGLRRSAW